MGVREIPFYFDFVSPYSWLALKQAPAFARRHGVRWHLRPVVYAKLLETFGLLGPAETDVKRRYTFFDVARCAADLGAGFTGPPAHPFRSLEAQRTAVLFRTEARALDLCVAISDACWGDGEDLTRINVLERIVSQAGFDGQDLDLRIRDSAVKAELRRLTDEAIALGVFGVPTFVCGSELFWGHDRMRHLADRLEGRLASSPEHAERMLARPMGVVRRTRPLESG